MNKNDFEATKNRLQSYKNKKQAYKNKLQKFTKEELIEAAANLNDNMREIYLTILIEVTTSSIEEEIANLKNQYDALKLKYLDHHQKIEDSTKLQEIFTPIEQRIMHLINKEKKINNI